jgi:hypothetical protein
MKGREKSPALCKSKRIEKMNSNKAKSKSVLSLIVNITIIVITAYAMSKFFMSTGDANMQVSGIRSFKYFTNLSNYFAAIAALICIPYNVKNIRKGTNLLPRGVYLPKFYATVTVTVTFLTCVFFLAPINILILAPYGVPPVRAYLFMFAGNTFILHFLTPVLSILSVILLDATEGFDKKYVKYGMVFVFFYAILYVVMVVFIGPEKGGWTDFYHFTFGGKMYMAPVSGVVMLFFTWLIARCEWKLYRKANKEE